MAAGITDDLNDEVLTYYRTLTSSLTNSKLLKYFSHKESFILGSANPSIATKCRYCHEHNVKFLKIRILSKRARKTIRNMQPCDLLQGHNILSSTCKTCGKTSISNAINRTMCHTSFDQKIATPKLSDSQKIKGTPDVANSKSSSKKRPRKSGSKLQQQLQKSRAKQACQNTKVSLSDFLQL